MLVRCPACTASLLLQPDQAECQECGATYPRRYGILDLLGTPPAPIARELRGLASEQGLNIDADGFDTVKFMIVDSIESPAALMEQTRADPIQYYQLTASAYLEGLGRCLLDSDLKVLEIGADRTLWNLRSIRDLCREAVALNIFFHVVRDAPPPDWPVRVLADMNHLPFTDGYFDLVLCSATLHHSTDISGALAEVSRTLRPGGRALVVNEPVAGLAKSLGGRTGHNCDVEIHEGPVSLAQWRSAIRRSGLKAEQFLPAWLASKAARAGLLPARTRFRSLARLIAPAMRRPSIADLVTAAARVPGQALLGLPFNAVLWKPESPASPRQGAG